jgi:hypothetical protein
MLLRIGALLVVTGLTLALVLGSLFVVVGLMLMVCGGIVLASGMESLLAEETAEGEIPAKPIDADHGEIAA